MYALPIIVMVSLGLRSKLCSNPAMPSVAQMQTEATPRVRYIPRWVPWKRAFVFWWPFIKDPTVYVPCKRKDIYSWVDRTLAHEAVHVTQWRHYGRIGFMWRYLRPGWRFSLEAQAWAASVRWAMQNRPGSQQRTWVFQFAEKLATGYGLKYPLERCRAAIEVWL